MTVRRTKGPEEQRQERITDALERFGWLWCHFRPAYTEKGYRTALSGHPGAPDILAVHEAREMLILVEVKSNTGTLTEAQRSWAFALCRAGVYWLVNSDEAERELLDFISDGRLT